MIGALLDPFAFDQECIDEFVRSKKTTKRQILKNYAFDDFGIKFESRPLNEPQSPVSVRETLAAKFSNKKQTNSSSHSDTDNDLDEIDQFLSINKHKIKKVLPLNEWFALDRTKKSHPSMYQLSQRDQLAAK